MFNESWSEELKHQQQALTSLGNQAVGIAQGINEQCVEMEVMKVKWLENQLERQRYQLTHTKGVIKIVKDKDKRFENIVSILNEALFAGLAGGNAVAGLAGGMSGVNSTLQSYGQADYVVVFGERISAVPADGVEESSNVIKWGDLKEKLNEVVDKATNGQKLGDIDEIVAYILENR
jgi:hypothetical protein